MDTSETTRFAVDILLLALACVVGVANLRLFVGLIARRRIRRRGAIIWISLLIVGTLGVLDAFYWEPYWVQVTRHRIETPKLAKGSTLRIAQLTDLHMPGDLSRREMRALRAVRSLHPDVIVLTGDYTNDRNRAALRALVRLTKMLSQVAPVYGVEGNWDSSRDIDSLRNGGVKFLHGWTTIPCQGGGEIALGGTEWYGGEAGRMSRSCRGLYAIVLCHMPCHFEKLAGKGADLVLAGHTHGGQVRLPVFGALLPARKLIGRYQMGFYKYGKSVMYVNRGLGCEGQGAPQVRFCCRPEVALIQIVGTGKDKR
jgi:uncharacterized protein